MLFMYQYIVKISSKKQHYLKGERMNVPENKDAPVKSQSEIIVEAPYNQMEYKKVFCKIARY